MLDNLTDNEVAIITELAIHGMYRYRKDNFRYNKYLQIAEKLLEEMRINRRAEKWIVPLMVEFTEAQIMYVPEQ